MTVDRVTVPLLECVPAELAARITGEVGVLTIGIGAGSGCDGQVLVAHDLVGMTPPPWPRFVKPQADIRASVARAVRQWQQDVARLPASG